MKRWRLSSEIDVQAINARRRSTWKQGALANLLPAGGALDDAAGVLVDRAPSRAAGRPFKEQSLTFVFPFPPSVNHSTDPDGRGGRLLTDEHRQFRQDVAFVVINRSAQLRLAGRLHVLITLQADDKRRFDIDNRIKAVLDALQHADVFLDDSQIDKLEVQRVTADRRACIVTVREIAA